MKWVSVVAAFALFALASVSAQERPAADSLEGIWISETVYPAALRGELVVRRDGGAWQASISGERTDFAVTGSDVRFSFGANGSYRGRLRGGAIEGFWLRPSGATEDRTDPGGSGQPFATPLTLRASGRNVWRGDVAPLEDRFTLYLSIFRDEQGVLTGAFRNPQLNSRGGASRFAVTREGDALTFLVRFEGGEIRHDATVLSNPERIRILWSDIGSELELARATPAQAASFFPRPPGGAPYAYQRPPETGDGWRTARARDVGMDEAVLAAAVERIVNSDPTARPPTLMHSMLVAHRGRLVLEEYFFGHDRDTVHDIRSAGKTFSSILMGAAVREGVNISPDTRVYDLMAARGPFANPDARKADITLAHLMTHSAGLACNDNDEASPGNEGTMWTQDGEADWWKYTLDLPMAHDPGARYAYCSGNLNLVGGALTVATGVWLPEYFDRTIARPLQFGRYHWNLTPNGEGYLGGGAFMRPRDLLKVGQMYLDGGVWRGHRVVSREWVSFSTAPRIEITPQTTGLTEEEFGNFYGRGVDGYAWHRFSTSVGERTVEGYQASGNGGQVLIVVPEYDLVVVFTGGNYMQGGVWSQWGQIVGAQIIPAIAAN
jgi:CubicO group peptidase (beta-lactamase class C family)